MAQISVITGAAGGMGYHTARIAGKKMPVLVSDVSQSGVDRALAGLRAEGVIAEGMVCDVTDRAQVRALAEKAAAMGEIAAVYNVAGLSPTLCADGEKIMRVNAFGVYYSNEEFSRVMRGGVFVNIASSTAHIVPKDRQPVQLFSLVFSDEAAFEVAMLKLAQTANSAYAMSKCFVKYYTEKSAYMRADQYGIRVVSVSPGAIDTAMTQTESAAAGTARSVSWSGLHRIGTPEELAYTIVCMGDVGNSYLTGVDLLVDGGGISEGFDGTSERGAQKADLDALLKQH